MVTKGFAFLLKAKPGKEQELEDFLKAAEPLAEAEPDTTTWFAYKVDDETYGIFDGFLDDAGRQAHADGLIATGLMERADELLSETPELIKVDILASKLPGGSAEKMMGQDQKMMG